MIAPDGGRLDGGRLDGGRLDGGRLDGGRPRRTDRAGGIEIAFGCGAPVRLRGEVSAARSARRRCGQVIDLLR